MTTIDRTGMFNLGNCPVKRLDYNARQLSGPGVSGLPRDRNAARSVLRGAVAAGTNHIDASDYHGRRLVIQLILEAPTP